jgi:hypothetical protein
MCLSGFFGVYKFNFLTLNTMLNHWKKSQSDDTHFEREKNYCHEKTIPILTMLKDYYTHDGGISTGKHAVDA